MKCVCILVMAVWSLAALGQTTATAQSNIPPVQNENKAGAAAALSSCAQDETGQDEDSVAKRVSLYYFSDVPRLMKMLNGKTTKVVDREFTDEAAKQHDSLAQEEANLINAQAKVSGLQTELLSLKEKLRQSQANVVSLQTVLDRSSADLITTKRRQTRAADQLGKAQDDANSHQADSTQKTALEQAEENKKNADQQVEDAQRRNDQAKSDHDAAAAKLESDQKDPAGLAASVNTTQANLEEAQREVAVRSQAALLAASAESQSFARARDNAPFWCATGDPHNSDPAQRVTMFAFDDS